MTEENEAVAVEPVVSKTDKVRKFAEMFFYKIDRTLAIVGIVVICVVAKATEQTSNPIMQAGISALGVYIGGRTVSK